MAWVPRIDAADGPIYLAIADAIGAAVSAGELRAGDQLPTHRALAGTLGVDLTTVTRAYAEARRRGLLQATVGRGSFVRSAPAAAVARVRPLEGPVDLGMNLPPLPADLPLKELLQEGFSRVLATAPTAELLTYRAGCGTPEERRAGAEWLRPILGGYDPEQVLLSPGAQPALLAVLHTLAKPGETVLTDAVTYPGIRTAAAQAGIRLIGIAADEQGLLPEAVEQACRTLRPQAFYCVPTIHNPTTATMPLNRRQAIAELARRHRLPIIEDDAYGHLPATPLPAIASLAPELGFYIATVSKVLSPALRVAYLVAPDTNWAARLCAALRGNVLMGSPLLTGLLTAWIRDGTASTVTAAIRREATARQKIAAELLPAGTYAAHPEGLHLWLRLPARWDRRDFVAHLRRRDGPAVVPSDAFAVASDTPPPPDAVRVSLGAASSRDALRAALRSIATALREDGTTAFANVV